MRNVVSMIVLTLFLVAPDAVVGAQEATRPVKNTAEMSEAVMRALSKDSCTLISADSRDGYGADHLAMIFRLRCATEQTSVSAVLKELPNQAGFTVEEVTLYPRVSSENTEPSVDVRFIAIAPARN